MFDKITAGWIIIGNNQFSIPFTLFMIFYFITSMESNSIEHQQLETQIKILEILKKDNKQIRKELEKSNNTNKEIIQLLNKLLTK